MAKILIVEDEVDVITLLTKRLSKKGFGILSAKDTFEAIKILHEKLPDLVILDLMLPAGGGVTVLRNLRADKKTSRIPVVVLTANQSPGYKDKVMQEGVEAYLEKPYDAAELLATIDNILKKSSSGK